ncbi:hypothetical protein B566_EDAN006036 [Ephemera danica]|nr:hypothetical protein B566_EDAN006036 [Ephemera danica]
MAFTTANMRCNLMMKTALFLTISAALVVARPSPEAEGGYRDEDEDSTAEQTASEALSDNTISAAEQEEDPRLLPYGALKLAVVGEPWGALKLAMALAEKDRMASERLLTERDSVEVSATPEPDTEVVESLSADEPRPCDGVRSEGTTLILAPYAKAVAGAGGTAIASPESRAVTRHAADVIIFQPHVVAIVGPGGRAVASSRLIIDLVEWRFLSRFCRRDGKQLIYYPISAAPVGPPVYFYPAQPPPAATTKTPKEDLESTEILPPPEGASVAEAQPIGIAIAGPGGVAAAQPIGTAIVGPHGLAIARPIGTAIAGVPGCFVSLAIVSEFPIWDEEAHCQCSVRDFQGRALSRTHDDIQVWCLHHAQLTRTPNTQQSIIAALISASRQDEREETTHQRSTC